MSAVEHRLSLSAGIAMFKAMVLIKRRSGMSMEDFIAYYENRHAPLGISKITNLKRYVRHFLRPYGDATYPGGPESPYDVLTELWFENESEFQRAMAVLSDPETAAIIGADEENLFDRSSIRFMLMEDRETEIG